MTASPKPSLSPAQLEIMNIVWETPGVTVAQIWQAQLGAGKRIARNTVQTTVARLQAKGWLRYQREGNTFRFTAARPRQRAVSRLVSRLLDTAFAGSATELILALLQNNPVSPEEARQIRRLIDQVEKERKP
jgi:predicted transcriptional regulator